MVLHQGLARKRTAGLFFWVAFRSILNWMDLDHLTKYWITTTLTTSQHLRLAQVPLKYAAQQRHVHDRTDVHWIDSTEWGPCSSLLNGVIIVIPGYDIPLTSVKWFFMHCKYFTTKHLPCHYLPNTAPTTQPQLSWNSSCFISFQIWTQVTLPDIFLLNPTTWGGPACSRECSTSQVSIPSNGSHERSGRRTPHLDASRGVFAPQGRMNLEAGLAAGTLRERLDAALLDWETSCKGKTSWSYFQGTGGPEKERKMREGWWFIWRGGGGSQF